MFGLGLALSFCFLQGPQSTPSGIPWVVETGVWDDAKYWVDEDLWIDGIAWILDTGYWDDARYWNDSALWID
jgi:hypothetical protein